MMKKRTTTRSRASPTLMLDIPDSTTTGLMRVWKLTKKKISLLLPSSHGGADYLTIVMMKKIDLNI